MASSLPQIDPDDLLDLNNQYLVQEDGTLLEFNLEDAILPGVEITMAEIEAEVFEPENNFEPQSQHHTVFDPQPQPGPSSGLPSDGVRPRVISVICLLMTMGDQLREWSPDLIPNHPQHHRQWLSPKYQPP